MAKEQFLVTGAAIKCPFGTEKCRLLQGCNNGTAIIGEKCFMSVNDAVKNQNIKGFGTCKAKPDEKEEVKCMAQILLAKEWMNPVTKQKMPTTQGSAEAIHKDAKLLCMYGKTYISAVTTGQEELTESEKQFIKYMKENFGFDNDVIMIMVDVMRAIDKKYAYRSEKEKTWMFTRLTGGFYYGDGGPDNFLENSKETNLKQVIDQIMWSATAGIVGFTFMDKDWMKTPGTAYMDKEKRYFTNTLGISERDYYKLRFETRVQHEITSRPGVTYPEYFLNQGEHREKWKELFFKAEGYTGKEENIDDIFGDRWKTLYNEYTLYNEENLKKNKVDDWIKEKAPVEYDEIISSNLNASPKYNDFLHQQITTASNLIPDNRDVVKILSDSMKNVINISSDYSPTASFTNAKIDMEEKMTRGIAKDLSGWLGDVVLGDRKLTNDDYKSDLDAVNIAGRVNREDLSFMDVINDYYGQDDFNRAKEFIQNNGGNKDIAMTKIKTEINTINIIKPLGEEGAHKDFLYSIENELNSLE